MTQNASSAANVCRRRMLGGAAEETGVRQVVTLPVRYEVTHAGQLVAGLLEDLLRFGRVEQCDSPRVS
jgi:hypothetical protein